MLCSSLHSRRLIRGEETRKQRCKFLCRRHLLNNDPVQTRRQVRDRERAMYCGAAFEPIGRPDPILLSCLPGLIGAPLGMGLAAEVARVQFGSSTTCGGRELIRNEAKWMFEDGKTVHKMEALRHNSRPLP